MKRLIVFAVLFYFTPGMVSASFFEDHATGWFWYQDSLEDKKSESEVLPPKVNLNPSEQMRAYREKIEDSLNLAILNPTEQNLRAYVKNYFEIIHKSQQFTDAYQLMLLRNPMFDYSLRFPTNPIAQRVYEQQKESEVQTAIQAFAKTHGFFFFFSDSCQYCRLFAPILKSFADKYQISVLAINLGEQKLKEFPNAFPDNGAAHLFKVSGLPALFAVNPKTREVIPVANGLISLSELEDNVFRVMNHQQRNMRPIKAGENRND